MQQEGPPGEDRRGLLHQVPSDSRAAGGQAVSADLVFYSDRPAELGPGSKEGARKLAAAALILHHLEEFEGLVKKHEEIMLAEALSERGL